MRICQVCASELAPDATKCHVCGAAVASQPAQQPAKSQPPKKAKKKKKLGFKITAAVLALVILAVSGLFVADSIMYKNEVEAEEYITDFPVLKTETDFMVYDEEDFPSTEYSIKVERVLYGGILKSELFKQTKIIINETSTEPVYHIDFEKDGEYTITLEDISNEDNEAETTMPLDAETDSDIQADEVTDFEDDDDEKESLVVIIKVKVENASKEAIDKVNINSKPGDEPVEIPSNDGETTEPDSDSSVQETNELTGTYKGSYFAGQGETGLTLTVVYTEGEQYKALFEFYNLPGKTNAQSGKYYMDVTYDDASDTYSFTATEWIEKPSTYIFVNLKGQLNGDILSGESPTKFSVAKTTTDDDTATAVDAYTRDAEIYTAFLTGGELDYIISDLDKAYVEIETCMADFNDDGTHELVLSMMYTQSPGVRGYYTRYAAYAIVDGSVTRIYELEYGGGSGGGDRILIKYDTQQKKHVIAGELFYREGAWASIYTIDICEFNGRTLQTAIETSQNYISHEATWYSEDIAKVKNETSKWVDSDGIFKFFKLNGSYISESEYNEISARFTEPTDSAYQMKKGTYSNPLGL